jgi:hypothetical protein
MIRTFLSVAAAALLISVILSTPASSAETGEASIPSGGHRAWLMEVDQSFTIKYDIQSDVTNPINVLVIPADEYADYQEGRQYSYLAQASRMNITQASVEAPLDAGRYYLVVEDVPNGSASVGEAISYDINTMVQSMGDDTMEMVLTAGAMVILLLVMVVLVDVASRRKK